MRASIVVGVLAVLAFGAGALVVLGGEPPPAPARADAIVALAGADERAQTAIAMFDDGVTDRLIVSVPGPDDDVDEKSATSRRLCEDPSPAVTCIVPDPPTTRGEVQAIRHLAAEEGWDHVLVVTNGYHARRTTLLLDQCLHADATVVQVPGVQNPIRRAGWVIHETGGLLHTWLLPECD